MIVPDEQMDYCLLWIDFQHNYFGMELSVLIFCITEQLSISLQAEEICVDDCYMAVDLCIKSLERIRTDVKFKDFYESVVMKASQLLCDPPVLHRQRRNQGDWMMGHHSIPSALLRHTTERSILRPLTMSKVIFIEDLR